MPLPFIPSINLPIHTDYYQPRIYYVSSITRGVTTIVTSASKLDYTIGQQVKLTLPMQCGMREINNQYAYVLSLPSDYSVEIDINSSSYSSYSQLSTGTLGQILAVGDINQGQQNLTQSSQTNYVEGAFINISPN
ncbi:MAG: hypothetical protein KGI50_05310 [Patescibacteria group bacterium]|nr:hypothetical protein [Patescibacteria group bacterium]MDE2438722.1 hypothetical protein [Patescibacteria group bacterium]